MEMNESAIVAQVTETPTTPDSEIKGGIESTYREYAPLYEQFGVEKNSKNDKALEQIWEYCKSQAPAQDKDSVILQVIKFNHELGTPGVGEMPYSKMLNYIRVYRQFKQSGDLLEDLKKA
jgi:hypothetical protein